MFVGCRAELPKPVEIPQVQFLDWWLHARCLRLGCTCRAGSTGAGRTFEVFPQFLVQVVDKTVEFPVAVILTTSR